MQDTSFIYKDGNFKNKDASFTNTGGSFIKMEKSYNFGTATLLLLVCYFRIRVL